MSVSDDASGTGGGTLQVWRVSDLVYRPEEEVVAELEPYREFIVTGQEGKLPGKAAEGKADGAGGGAGVDTTKDSAVEIVT